MGEENINKNHEPLIGKRTFTTDEQADSWCDEETKDLNLVEM
jgi:hypothetical protein